MTDPDFDAAGTYDKDYPHTQVRRTEMIRKALMHHPVHRRVTLTLHHISA